MAQSEKKRADNYEQQLKIIVKALYQWQKINYYQQLEIDVEKQINASLTDKEITPQEQQFKIQVNPNNN